MSDLSIEDDEMLHNLVDEVIHSQGWSIYARHVRNYHNSVQVENQTAMNTAKITMGVVKILLRRKRLLTNVLMMKLMK